MKTKVSLVAAAGLLLLTLGCSTVDSRIAKNRAAFSTWPPAVQDKVVVGQIAVGFTPEQVRVALGEPDVKWTRTSGDGTSEVWSYRDRGPRYGVGVGIGGFRRSGAFGMGLNTTGGGYGRGERMRVTFDSTGHVAEMESVAR